MLFYQNVNQNAENDLQMFQIGGIGPYASDITILEGANLKQGSASGFNSPTFRPPKGIKRGSPEA